MAKKILVTGGAGFIGAHLVRELIKEGAELVVIDNFSDYYDPQLKHDRVKEFIPEGSVEFLNVDLTDGEELKKVFRTHAFDAICHLAGRAGVRDSLLHPHLYEQANVVATINIFECAKEFGVPHVVFASSSSVYGGNTKVPFSETDLVDHPVSFYAATKKTCELIAYTYHHLYNTSVTALRFFTVFGPWGRPDMAYFKFADLISAGKPIDVYNFGKMKRDFIYIDDIVSGIRASLARPFPYEVINLGNNNPIDLLEFIRYIEDAFGKTAQKRMMPIQPGDVPVTYADVTKAKKLLDFSPTTSVEQGIKNFVQWYREYYDR